MNPRMKGRVWRWTTMAGIGLAGGVVIEFVLRGPWHEQTLWWFVAAVLGREVGDTVEEIATARQRQRDARRFAVEAAARAIEAERRRDRDES